MFESEHRYFCIGKYLGRGGGNGWEWGYCTQGHTLQAIKTASGSRNKAARVEMLALFQNEIGYSHGQIATSCVPSPFSNVNQTTLQHCLPHYEENIVPVIGASFVSISVFSFRFPFPVSIFHFQFPFYFHFLLFHMPLLITPLHNLLKPNKQLQRLSFCSRIPQQQPWCEAVLYSPDPPFLLGGGGLGTRLVLVMPEFW